MKRQVVAVSLNERYLVLEITIHIFCFKSTQKFSFAFCYRDSMCLYHQTCIRVAKSCIASDQNGGLLGEMTNTTSQTWRSCSTINHVLPTLRAGRHSRIQRCNVFFGLNVVSSSDSGTNSNSPPNWPKRTWLSVSGTSFYGIADWYFNGLRSASASVTSALHRNVCNDRFAAFIVASGAPPKMRCKWTWNGLIYCRFSYLLLVKLSNQIA